MGVMKRRLLVKRVAAGVVLGTGVPLRLLAQTPARVPRIGVLRWGVQGDDYQPGLARALAELGYREGQTVTIDWRWATKADVAQRHASELMALKPDLLVASGTPAAVVLRDAARGLPLIFAVADPVGAGLVASLARPGGTATGVSNNLPLLAAKQLQLMGETLPALQRVAFLGSTQDPATRIFLQELEGAAAALRVRLVPLMIGPISELDAAADAMVRERAQAVVVQPLFTLGPSRVLAEALNRRRIPSVSAFRTFAIDGGLMAYGPSRADSFRRTASFVDRVWKGALPGNLPVEEPTAYELAFNQTTAKALGITISSAMLRRADEVFG
jgi:putative ABC transport system substrate-binding protein